MIDNETFNDKQSIEETGESIWQNLLQHTGKLSKVPKTSEAEIPQ